MAVSHLVLQHLLSLLNRHVGIDVVGIHIQVRSIHVSGPHIHVLGVQVGIGTVVHVHIHVSTAIQPLLVLTHYDRDMSTVHFLDYWHSHGRNDFLLVAVEYLVPCVHVWWKMGDL